MPIIFSYKHLFSHLLGDIFNNILIATKNKPPPRDFTLPHDNPPPQGKPQIKRKSNKRIPNKNATLLPDYHRSHRKNLYFIKISHLLIVIYSHLETIPLEKTAPNNDSFHSILNFYLTSVNISFFFLFERHEKQREIRPKLKEIFLEKNHPSGAPARLREEGGGVKRKLNSLQYIRFLFLCIKTLLNFQ